MGILSKAKIETDLEHWEMIIEPNCHLLDLKLGDRSIGWGGKL